MRLILPQMAKWKLRRGLSGAFLQTKRMRSILPTSTTLCPLGLSSCSLVDQDRAHMSCGCTGSFMTWTSPISLLLGGRPQVRYTGGSEVRWHDPREPLNINQSRPHPPRWFINLVVFLVFAKQGFQHLAKNSQKYMLTLPTTSVKAKSYSSSNSSSRCTASQARQKLSIKSSKLKIRNHKNTYTCIFY
jgi:hypothetical protein